MFAEDIIAALQKYDKHLWGINANYKEAAKLIGLDKPGRIKSILFTKTADPNPQGKRGVYIYEWNGHLQWFKCPDAAGGPRSATKNKAIGHKSWDRLKQLFAEKRGLIESDGVTMAFVIRLCRANRLPANEHIVTELLKLRKITLKGVC